MATKEPPTMETEEGRTRRFGAASSSHGPTAVMGDIASGAKDAAGSVQKMATEMATEVANQLPSMAATTRDVVGQAAHQMETSTSEALFAGTTLSLGIALGLLIGGANRVLVALALLPAAAMGATLLDRQARASAPDGRFAS